MSKKVLLVLLLAVVTLSYNWGYGTYDYNCPGCKPAAIKIKNCPQVWCYRCNENQVFNSDTLYCDCKEGYVPINGYCGKCGQGYEYDPVLMQCIGVNPCGYNQHLVSGVCKCLPGLQVIQNICQRCPENQTFFPQYDACRCTSGYSLINGTCIFKPCVDNEVYDMDKQACVCAQGYNVINGSCAQCPLQTVYNPASQACDPFIPPNCGFNEYYFEHCCFCEIGYVRIGGSCVTCPANSFYDWNTDSCVCMPGYYFVGEEVKQIPYQMHDTGSSFTSNPSYHYSYKAPYTGVPVSEPVIIVGSNYDGSKINKNGHNINNVIHPPPINSRR